MPSFYTLLSGLGLTSPLLKLCPWKLPPPSQSTVQVLAFSLWKVETGGFGAMSSWSSPVWKQLICSAAGRAQTFWEKQGQARERKLWLNLILAQVIPLSYRSDTILFKTHQNMSLFELWKRICLEPNTTFGRSMSARGSWATSCQGTKEGGGFQSQAARESGNTNMHSPEMSVLWSFGWSRDAIVTLAQQLLPVSFLYKLWKLL